MDVDKAGAFAALDDPGRTWTLMVRCLDGRLDASIRERAEPPTPRVKAGQFAGTLAADGVAFGFAAQTYSEDGYLIADPAAILQPVEHSLDLAFHFTSGVDVHFLDGHMVEALGQVRRLCAAAVS